MKTTHPAPRAFTVSLILLMGAGASNSARGETVFSQDFENGLGPNESTFGRFSINDTLTTLNNGTLMMGHAESYGPLGGGATPLPSYSYYEVLLDLRGFTDAELRFDFTGGIEKDFDGFNVLATTERRFSPPTGLLTPTAGSAFQYDADPLIIHGASSPELGATAWSSPADPSVIVKDLAAVFDLSAFDDQKVKVRFQFGTDALEGGEGANFDNIVVEATALPDSDGDGMHDGYEDAHNLDRDVDDRLLDRDGDGINNITEYNNCTNPDNVDSDGDGLNDNVETNTGVFVSSTDSGSDPNDPDTDGDGLSDAAEVQIHRSDPNKSDTDGDGFDDKTEVDQGTSPSDPNSHPALPIPIGYWPQDGDLLNVAQDNYHGIPDGGTVPFDTGLFGEAVHLDGSQSIILENSGTDFTFVGQDLSVSVWFTADVIDTSWQCVIAKGEGNSWRMHRRGGDNPPQMAWTGGNGDTPAHSNPITVGGDPETWHHVVGVTDTANAVEILYQDGVEIARKALGGGLVQNSTNPARIGENPDALNRRWKGKIDDVAIWNAALDPAEIQAIHQAGREGISLGDFLNPPQSDPLGLAVRNAAGQLEISWNSTAGNLYDLLSELPENLSLTNVPELWAAFGAHTAIAATPPRNTLTIPYPGDAERYFVISQYPTPPVKAFSDDFENGQGSWVTGDSGVPVPPNDTPSSPTATKWELGTPDAGVAGSPPSAKSGATCFGTDLDGSYVEDTGIFLRTPAIDLTNFVGATLKYWRYYDIESNFDYGRVRLLDAADDSEIAVLEEVIDGTISDWEQVCIDLPAEAAGKSVKIEFILAADNFNTNAQAGFYLDDVCVEAVPE